MSACRLLLLGPPQVERETGVVHLHLRKVLALAAYLAVEQREFSREYLATLLWPDRGRPTAMANLRRTLSQLRETMHDGCVVTDGDHISLDFASVAVDTEEFQSLLPAAPDRPDLQRLEHAVALYRGDFMEGFTLGKCLEFDQWQDVIRERLRSELDTALGLLTTGYLRIERPELAQPYARRWLELDVTNEAAHRTLMAIYAGTHRPDAARHQYQTCVRILEQEGLPPDEETTALYESIAGNSNSRHDNGDAIGRDGTAAPNGTAHTGELLSARAAGRPDEGRRRRVRRWFAVAIFLIVSAASAVFASRSALFPQDVSAGPLQVVRVNGEFSEVVADFGCSGRRSQLVDYSVFFTQDGSLGLGQSYEVYSSTVRVRQRETARLDIPVADINAFINTHNVRIPPGTYTASVMTDPQDLLEELSEHNNRALSSASFSFAGASGVPILDVTISYRASAPLDETAPLCVYVGDRADAANPDRWGRFTLIRDGRYFFPLEVLPRPQAPSSGYFFIVVHETGHFEPRPYLFGPGIPAGIYKEVPGNLAYGGFTAASGSPMFPGETYAVTFTDVVSPPADQYETDDFLELGTLIDHAELPVHQYHTFHDEGSGDLDRDWFQIYLKDRDTLTIETFSAGGLLETDTAIDFNDSHDYITSAMDKSPLDHYSRLSYTNNTGEDQMYHFVVKPYNQYNPGVHRIGEYVLEVRK